MPIEVDNADNGENNKPTEANPTPSLTPSTPAATPSTDSPKRDQVVQRPAPSPNAPLPPVGSPPRDIEQDYVHPGHHQPNTNTNTNTNNTRTSQGTRSMNISSRTNYGMSRAATSQDMRAMIEAIDKIAEGEAEQPVKFSFFSLDGEKEGLLISAVVVVATPKNATADNKFAAHHTLLLGSTARGVNAVEMTAQVGNSPVKYERLVIAADAYDATLRSRVAEVVKASFPGFNLIDADATAIPADLDLRSEEAVRNVIANATTAASTLLSSQIANDAWVINEAVAQQTFQNDIKSSWAHFTDLTGQPVRGDIVLEMAMLTGRNQNQQNTGEFQYNTNQARQLITQITSYIDLVYTPQVVSNNFGFGGLSQGVAQKAEELKIYTPRLVVTNVDAPDEACELPVILQGLATMQALYNDNRWVNALVAQHKNGAQHADQNANIRDLSAIGLEAPVVMPVGYMGGELPKAGRLPLNSANVGDAMLTAAIQTYFHMDQLLFSMDVQECGASSWITSPFAAAARGDQFAIRDILEAADLLTGGRFSPIYKAANQGQLRNPVINDNMYVNLGYYLSNSGKRDIRDVDYLAVLNATGDTTDADIKDWADLQANSEVDAMFRLTETRRIQQRLFESMVITGRAVRITFHPTFIFSLAAAVGEAGLVYETKMGMAAPQSTTRMVPQYLRNLPTGLGNAGQFVAAGMRRTQAGSVAAGSFGRYAHQRNVAGNTGAGNY